MLVCINWRPSTLVRHDVATRWNESERSRESCNDSQAASTVDDGGTELEYDGNDDEALDQISQLERGATDDASGWSEASPSQSDVSLMRERMSGGHESEQDLASLSNLPLNVRAVSVASWDVGSEPTLGTDGGTDPDVAAASGLPEDESDAEDDEEDDEFEAADSLDLGAVALCVSGGVKVHSICFPLRSGNHSCIYLDVVMAYF